ncbi:GNAT family N-acetyltransferase [Streptomyces sp. NPDC096311]|uniref:GNAT family N-acetyltransferase n=1 Tax=Streptomyces sp. NPDC096311 TaxID=3366083 RepID=UPI003802373D
MNRHIPFARLHNFRDLGGYATEDGRTVRRSRLYRADSLGKLIPGTADWELFLSLGVRTVVDLRYPWETESKGRVPEHPSLAYHNQSIEHRPYDQAALGPEVAPGPYLAERFAEVAEDGTKEIRETLQLIARAAESDTPLAFHCASGKDRTGLVAALVLSLLGVPDQTIVEDFTLTERATPLLVADWRTDNPDRELLWPAYGTAPAEIMTRFLATMNSRYGSVQSYVTETLGLDTAFTSALRATLLEPASPLTFRRATETDIPTLVRLRDEAARWQKRTAPDIEQWTPGQLGETHFRTRIQEGEVWLAHLGPDVVGACELWWDDPAAWGLQPPTAGYIHRLMTDHRTAPPGTGRHILAHAERRTAASGRPLSRLDCISTNPHLRRYYEAAGYTVVGEQPMKDGGLGNPYAVTLLEKRLR